MAAAVRDGRRRDRRSAGGAARSARGDPRAPRGATPRRRPFRDGGGRRHTDAGAAPRSRDHLSRQDDRLPGHHRVGHRPRHCVDSPAEGRGHLDLRAVLSRPVRKRVYRLHVATVPRVRLELPAPADRTLVVTSANALAAQYSDYCVLPRCRGVPHLGRRNRCRRRNGDQHQRRRRARRRQSRIADVQQSRAGLQGRAGYRHVAAGAARSGLPRRQARHHAALRRE